MDVELVNEHIDALINGKKIMTPKYNMKTGYRDGDGHPFEIEEVSAHPDSHFEPEIARIRIIIIIIIIIIINRGVSWSLRGSMP